MIPTGVGGALDGVQLYFRLASRVTLAGRPARAKFVLVWGPPNQGSFELDRSNLARSWVPQSKKYHTHLNDLERWVTEQAPVLHVTPLAHEMGFKDLETAPE